MASSAAESVGRRQGEGEDKMQEDGEATEFTLGADTMAWLSEEGGKRLRRLKAITGADLRASEDGQKLLLRLKDGAAGGRAWAELCVQAMCALRTGQALDVSSMNTTSWEAPLSVVEVPREEAKGYIQGKAGARLLQLSEESDAIAVFGREATGADSVSGQAAPASGAGANSGLVLEVGALVEAKYNGRDRWFEAKILEVGQSTVKVKWTYDDDVPASDVPTADLRAPARQAAESKDKAEDAQPLQVGSLVEAKFGDKARWFEAIVLGVGESTVKVKWTYDEDVPPSEVPKSNVKRRPRAPADKLYVFGADCRRRLELELKVLNLIESKVPGFVSSRPKKTDTCPGIGWGVLPLMNDGELKAKVIGKGGSVRHKIGKACGSSLEYIGNLAHFVGTGQERACTAALLELVQNSSNGSVERVPNVLEAICTRITVPQEASPMVTGKQRANLNQLEEDTGTLSFWAAAVGQGESWLSEGKLVEGRFKNRWFEATILEITKGENGDGNVKVRWDYDENETSVLPVSDIREVADGSAHGCAAAPESRTLVVFGPERSRKQAELKVMAIVELKCPGTFASFQPPTATGDEAFIHEVLQLSQQETQHCKEKRWRAAAAAAHCVVEQIGESFHLAGTSMERSRAQSYLRWVAQPKLIAAETSGRSDVEELRVLGSKRANLPEHTVAAIEQETETLAIFEGGVSATADARLFVCCYDAAKRAAAVAKLRRQQDRTPASRPASDQDAWREPTTSQVVYVVSKEEEERRRKRAERFGTPPPAKKR